MTDKQPIELHSRVVRECQICGSHDLTSVLFLGYLPPVNRVRPIGERPAEEDWYPAQLLFCPACTLVQLGLVVDATILFPKDYPYTSSTTRALRENFAEFFQETRDLLQLQRSDLVLDIGSNDGNLLSNFQGYCRTVGVTPEDVGQIAMSRGIPTIQAYFGPGIESLVKTEFGRPRVITATNVFAHIDAIDSVVETILSLLTDDGIFISESHYLLALLENLQYDTIYHEHLRYYSLTSLSALLHKHGLEVFHVKEIPTHGGSIRVYAARRGTQPVRPSVRTQLQKEKEKLLTEAVLAGFAGRVATSKLTLLGVVKQIKEQGQRIFGIGAPSRASTLINYVGIDDRMLDCVVEVTGSHKIGNYVPGTLIPIFEERRLFTEQPDYALLLSWHISDELIPKIREKGYRGRFVIPLPEPRIV